ncbi:MAG: RES domain-containing protein [Chthoniobacterales bacterium]|nr:RES domain-containing protein [Chthoniobacterales bacterium]
MPSGWRIDKPGREAFSGEGARRFGGRWNSPGVAVVYLSQHQSLAALEIFVHLQPLLPRAKYLAYFVEWEEAQMETLSPKKLPSDWRISPPGPATMQLGDQWVREERSVLLAVPSVILPSEINFLLNPAHPKFRQLRRHKPVEFAFDDRLAGR